MITGAGGEVSGHSDHPQPTDTEAVVRRLASTIDLMAAQLQAMHERLERQSQMAEQGFRRHRSVLPTIRPEGRQKSPAREGRPPSTRAQPQDDSLTRKGKYILIDTAPETERPHSMAQKRQHQQHP